MYNFRANKGVYNYSAEMLHYYKRLNSREGTPGVRIRAAENRARFVKYCFLRQRTAIVHRNDLLTRAYGKVFIMRK